MPHVDIELVSSLESLCRGEAQSLSQKVGEVVLLGAVTRPMCRAATYAAAPRQLKEIPEEVPPRWSWGVRLRSPVDWAERFLCLGTTVLPRSVSQGHDWALASEAPTA